MTDEEKKILLEMFDGKMEICYDLDNQLVIYTGRYPDPYCDKAKDLGGEEIWNDYDLGGEG